MQRTNQNNSKASFVAGPSRGGLCFQTLPAARRDKTKANGRSKSSFARGARFEPVADQQVSDGGRRRRKTKTKNPRAPGAVVGKRWHGRRRNRLGSGHLPHRVILRQTELLVEAAAGGRRVRFRGRGGG